jgi:rod shape-determining protein MreD
MKKIICLVFLSCFLIVLDNAFVPYISIGKYYPSLLFVFIICYSIINGRKEALILGVLTGLLQDAFFINGIGTNALTNMLMCLVAAYVGKSIFRHKSFVPILTCLALSLFKGIMIFVIFYILGQTADIKTFFFSSLYNMVIAVFMYKLVYKLCKLEFMKREWTF